MTIPDCLENNTFSALTKFSGELQSNSSGIRYRCSQTLKFLPFAFVVEVFPENFNFIAQFNLT